jgi:hypothetical protein
MVRVGLVPTGVDCGGTGPPHLVQGALCGARGCSNMGQALAGLQSTVALRQPGGRLRSQQEILPGQGHDAPDPLPLFPGGMVRFRGRSRTPPRQGEYAC